MLELGERLRARGATSGSDIAGFSPMMYMPRIVPACDRVHDLDHGEAGLRGRACVPQSCSNSRARSGVVDALVVRDTSSGSGPRRTRPARCSGRAADAARCPAGRSGRSSATARSGSARCRCRGRAARCPCPRGSSSPATSRTARATSRMRLARGCRRSAPSPRGCSPRRSRAAPRSRSVRSATNASSTRPSSMMACIIAFSSATSVSGLNCR